MACKLHCAAVVVKRKRLLCVMYLFSAHRPPQALALNHWLSHIYTVWQDSKKRRKKGYVVDTLLPHSGVRQTDAFVKELNFSCSCFANTCKMLNICEDLWSYKTKIHSQSAELAPGICLSLRVIDYQALTQALWWLNRLNHRLNHL